MSLKPLGYEAMLIGEAMYENHVEGPVRTGWGLGSPGVCSNPWCRRAQLGPTPAVILLPSLQQVPSCLRV